MVPENVDPNAVISQLKNLRNYDAIVLNGHGETNFDGNVGFLTGAIFPIKDMKNMEPHEKTWI